jgi:molecular chaperone DnaK (HSP70)
MSSHLGIDFGTTRVVVAAADRGNVPVVTFEGRDGEPREWYPALVALRGDEVRTGFAAEAVARDSNWHLVRSLKRILAASGPAHEIAGHPVRDLARRFLTDLHDALLRRSNLRPDGSAPLRVAAAVPANAAGAQRLLTADAFTAAGFDVVRMFDEPSAAGLEYARRRPKDAEVRKRHVAVFDLGGGTFDASVIAMADALHEVITTEGVRDLGGDDFDRVLLEMALADTGRAMPEPGPERDRLLEAARRGKEAFNPSTRRLSVEMEPDGLLATVDVADYEDAVRPLIDEAIDALDRALDRAAAAVGHEARDHAVIYQVGGASLLPTVGRMLRECWGRRVHRSPYPHAAVAMGLAIAAESGTDTAIAGRLTRTFGVWRERQSGADVVFDAVFTKDTPLPAPGEPPLAAVRRYRTAHDVAHYRFVETSRLHDDGSPAGGVTPWAEVAVATAPNLHRLDSPPADVRRLEHDGPEVTERYSLDRDGIIRVMIEDAEGHRVHIEPSTG